MGKKAKASRAPLQSLRSHTEPYVTVGEVAEYWLVSRKQIYKQIEAGTLRAIRLGPRLLRIRTEDAIDFERRANMHPPSPRRDAEAERPVETAVAHNTSRGRQR